MKSRTLKIERDGDFWKGKIKPKIRLKGNWLEQAGFKPGTYVSVKSLGPGIIELRAGKPLTNQSEAHQQTALPGTEV